MSLPDYFAPQAAVGGDLAAAEPYWSNDDYCAQEKLDGARYLLHKDMKGVVRIYSRQISRVNGFPVDKTLQLQHLAREFVHLAPPGTVLDGEVCAPGLTSSSNLVTRVTGSKPERGLEIQQRDGFLVYNAFDILAYDGELLTDEVYLKRIEKLHAAVMGGLHNFIKILPVYFTEADKKALYEKVIARGGEGIILKDVYAPYYQGERHRSWVKVKRQRTFDVVFMGIELANDTSVKKGEVLATPTRIAGQAGAIRYGQYVEVNDGPSDGLFSSLPHWELKQLGTVSGFDDSAREYITANADVLEGKVLEVTGQEQFKSGAIRHPRFLRWREDKAPEECLFRADEG